MNPTEKNIRASWALNCAVASIKKETAKTPEQFKSELFVRAIVFLELFEMVKAYIEPPLKAETGRSKAEKNDLKEEVREGVMMGEAEDSEEEIQLA